MRRWTPTLIAAIGACSGGGGGGTADAPPEPVRCDPSAAFMAPVEVAGINSDLDDAAARLSDDELEITFSRRTGGVWDLWRATRATVDDPFDAPTLMTTVNSISNDLWSTMTPDGLTLLYEADRTTPNVFHVWRSTRASRTAPFGPPMLRGDLRDGDIHPMLANDHALYFSSDLRGGLGLGEILRAPVDGNGAIGTPELVIGGVNSAALEDAPAVTPDEREIFFRRQVGGETDVYTAARSTPADGFGAASAVSGLAAPGISEVPNWISPDGCRLYFHTNATAGTAGVNVWMASRPTSPP